MPLPGYAKREKKQGVCHTDEAGRRGVLPLAFPVVLGHEGAGIVEKVGPGVTEFQPGDRVCLTYASCGSCGPCMEGRPYACEHISSSDQEDALKKCSMES